MPPGLQSKLLTAIATKRVRPLGATRESAMDVRIIAATNADLEAAIAAGRFRADLYYRLATVVLHLPPLRERRKAIPRLIKQFLAQAAAEAGRTAPEIDPEVLDLMTSYPWPGNVRELQNAVQRALILCRNDRITRTDLPAKLLGQERSDFSKEESFGRRPSLAQLEREYISHTLAATNDNKSEAASILGIYRKTIYRKLQEFSH